MAVLPNGPASERLDALLNISLERLEVEIYYFGVHYKSGGSYPLATRAPRHVLEKLCEWKKNDPNPWPYRSRKPYFSYFKGRLKRDWPAA